MSVNVLIVDDDDNLRQLLVTVIENIFENCQVIESDNGNGGKEIIENCDEDFDLIVCDYEMSFGNGDVVFNAYLEKKSKAKFILLSAVPFEQMQGLEKFIEGENGKYFKKGPGLKQLKELLTSFDFENSSLVKNLGFQKIRISYFWRYNFSKCDVFVRLSDRKFVKIINANENFDRDLIDKYSNKNQTHLYITDKDFDIFEVSVRERPFLDFDGQISEEKKNKMINATILGLARSVGISENVLNISEKYIGNLLDYSSKNKSLKYILEDLKNGPDFVYDHSYLLAVMCAAIVDQMASIPKNGKEKLCYAALFHDCGLENLELSSIFSQESEEFKQLDRKSKNDFLGHPKASADMLSKLASKVPNVDTIVLEHHELPDGNGFPRGLDSFRILPMSAVFILSHELVHQLFEIDFDREKLFDIYGNITRKYSDGHYVKVIEALPLVFTELKL